MIDDLVNIIKNIKLEGFTDKKIVRDESSRFEKIYDYIEFTTENQVILKKLEIHEIGFDELRRRYNNIYAIDSSTRAIDTPYMFIGVGSATCINRFTGDSLEYPSITSIMAQGEKSYDYIVIIPEIEGFEKDLLDKLEEKKVITRNPAGIRYSPRYSKYVVLDELRLLLENKVLNMLLEKERYRDLYVFVDGPIYYTPPLVYQVNEMHGIRDDLVKYYIESWKVLVGIRVNIIDKLMREKNITVLGIVKRLNRSNILSRRDPVGLSSGNMSDEAYLSVLTTLWFKDKKITPYYIGPIIYDPGKLPVKLPKKTIYYIGIPRRRITNETDYRNYMFYRIEYVEGAEENLEPVIYDSIHTGSILPLSILLADNRVKKITNALVNYFIRMTGLPGESTYQYITF